MSHIISSMPNFKRGLHYGVIYVVTSLFDRDYDEGGSIGRVVTPHLLHWLERFTGYKIEVIQRPEVKNTTLMARRINVGNAGKDAVVEMSLGYDSMRDIQCFVKSATDVLSTDEGDKVLDSEALNEVMRSISLDEYNYCDNLPAPKPSNLDAQKSILKQKRSWLGWITRSKRIVHEEADYGDDYLTDRGENSSCECAPAPVPEIAEEEEEIITIEHEREQALKAIQAQILDYVTKFHADPSQLINTLLEGKIVIGAKEQLSPLVVNNDLKIVLPNYNEVEVKMPALCRAIYIMFLKHPEGIALREIDKYRAELEDIYSIVMPGRDEEKAREAIDNLLDPLSNTLNEYISKIKRCFKLCIIDEELASNYIISGKRGESYRIALDPSLIILPHAVTGE